MKRFAIIALTFVLAGCIMTGCRRNDMQETTGSDTTNSTHSSTPITTSPGVTTLPAPTTGIQESSIGTDPMDDSTGNENVMPRGHINKARR